MISEPTVSSNPFLNNQQVRYKYVVSVFSNNERSVIHLQHFDELIIDTNGSNDSLVFFYFKGGFYLKVVL